MNTVTLVGRVVKDFELRYTAQTNTAVAYNTLAVKRKRKDKDGLYNSVFIPLRVFGKQAEILEQYVKKGNQLAISGELVIENYEDKDGNHKQATYVLVDSFDFLEKATNAQTEQKNNGTSYGTTYSPTEQNQSATMTDYTNGYDVTDNLPF